MRIHVYMHPIQEDPCTACLRLPALAANLPVLESETKGLMKGAYDRVAVEAFKLSYHNPQTIFFRIYPSYGDLIYLYLGPLERSP